MSVKSFLKSLLPIKSVDKNEQVPAHLRREIDRVLNDAHIKVAGIKAQHSVAAIEKSLEDDLAAFKVFTDKHVELLKAASAKKVAETTAVLPALALPPDPTPGAM